MPEPAIDSYANLSTAHRTRSKPAPACRCLFYTAACFMSLLVYVVAVLRRCLFYVVILSGAKDPCISSLPCFSCAQIRLLCENPLYAFSS
jgi:hypothetical protein